jgi:hypothetical protein
MTIATRTKAHLPLSSASFTGPASKARLNRQRFPTEPGPYGLALLAHPKLIDLGDGPRAALHGNLIERHER